MGPVEVAAGVFEAEAMRVEGDRGAVGAVLRALAGAVVVADGLRRGLDRRAGALTAGRGREDEAEVVEARADAWLKRDEGGGRSSSLESDGGAGILPSCKGEVAVEGSERLSELSSAHVHRQSCSRLARLCRLRRPRQSYEHLE